MKTITINVSEAVYQDYARESRKVGRPASELIRQAMSDFHDRHLSHRGSLRDRRPAEAGGPVQSLSAGDDLLGEMIR